VRASLIFAVFLLTLVGGLRNAAAHDITPGVLTLTESADSVEANDFTLAWTPPSEAASAGEEIRIDYPAACRATKSALTCDKALAGRIHFDNLRSTRIKIIVTIRFRDGRLVEGIATQAHPDVDVAGGGASTMSWLRFGIEHVLTGFDHVAFVIGLFLLIGPKSARRLVSTVTSFTVAHSITLALASLHILTIPRGPVEATIALSILLVARESLSKTPSLAKERPWLVAFLFGLVHGLGFASALGELPLERTAVATALLSFNLGIELAQLGILGVMLVLTRVLKAKLDRPFAYAIGVLGAFWFFDRATYLVLNR